MMTAFMASPFKRAFRGLRMSRDVGGRLTLAIVLFSTAITCVTTMAQIYFEYRENMSGIDVRMEEFRSSILPTIVEGTWNLDRALLKIQLNGLIRLPYIEKITISLPKNTDISAGLTTSTHTRIEKFPIIHESAGESKNSEQSIFLGEITLIVGMDKIYFELINHSVVILLSNAIKTLMVSIFAVYFFHNLVGKHLKHVSSYTKNLNIADRHIQDLRLDRVQPSKEPDVLDKLVEAINNMRHNLGDAYTALRDSKERFHDYANTASDWFWETGPDLKFIFVSDQARRHGIGDGFLNCLDHLLNLADDRIGAKYVEIFQNHLVFRDLDCIFELNSATTHIRIDGTPTFDANGNFAGYRGTARDVTEHVSLTIRLRQLNIELEEKVTERTKELSLSLETLRKAQQQVIRGEKMASLGVLAGGIAHEINTPVQFIGNNLSFLKDALDDLAPLLDVAMAPHDAAQTLPLGLKDVDLDFLRPEMIAAVEESLTGVQRITLIVRAIRDFAESGGTERTLRNPGDLLNTVAAVSSNAWKNVATMNFNIEPELPPVLCQHADIDQVLLALILNAAEAIEEKRTGSLGEIMLGARRVDDSVEFSVTDTGVGIPEEHREKVWDLFFTTKPPGRSTGQGMAICHNIIVNKEGGTIDFESTPGVGTRIFFRLAIDTSSSSQPHR